MFQLNTDKDDLDTSERFESRHQLYQPFDVTVLLFHQVIEIFALPDGNGLLIMITGIECDQRRGVGTTFIDSHDLRCTMVANGFAEEAQSFYCIPLRRQQEVDCQACGIDGPVKFHPFTTGVPQSAYAGENS